LTGLPSDVERIFWTPDGANLIASSATLLGSSLHRNVHHKVIVWDVTSGDMRHRFMDESVATLSHDGNILVTISNDGEWLESSDNTIEFPLCQNGCNNSAQSLE
jgi:hypothetical protein